MEFAGQVVLVTGASRGIGRAVAVRFAEQGARVAVHYRAAEAAAAATLASLAGDGHASFRADLAEPEAGAALAGDVMAAFGPIDVLVNNAGIYEPHPVLGTTPDEWRRAWRRTIDTNLLGPANLIHAVVPHMVAAGGGRIVNVSSRGAFRGEPDHPAYGASKAGLNSLGQSLARALAPHGIYVTTVAPGYVETDMAEADLSGPGGDAIRAQSPMGRVATADEVARVVVFLASPGAESTTGTVVDVNGASYLRS
ncbi:MAG TPA: SDR family oxidoreductase [Acidimicrobiales bacterium]|nr:SDR family oxidoreductase [Acidimicrobiales bacterium]